MKHGPVIKMIGGQTSGVHVRLVLAQRWIDDLLLGEGVTRENAIKFAKKLGAFECFSLAGAENLFEESFDMAVLGRQSLNPVFDRSDRNLGRSTLAQGRSNTCCEAQQGDSSQCRHRPASGFQRRATETLHRIFATPPQVTGDLFKFWRLIGHGRLKFGENGLV